MDKNMTKTIIQLAMALLLVAPWSLPGQVVVGGTTPDPSALLDIQSSDGGVLLPRLTTTERSAINNPATSLLIFNTTTSCLEMNLGTPAVPDWVRLNCRSGVVQSLDCSSAVVSGSLTSGQLASGVSVSVPYTGGNGGVHSGQTVTSTGVTGLTATLSAGDFASGTGNLTFAITGTPASGGTASFALNIGGQSCTLNVFVCTTGCCAKVSATEYKNFMCHNLGSANTSADPFTPGWEINGGYWQWGRSAEAAAGPTGSGAGEANDGTVGGWNTTFAPDGSWADGSKTANDPCPSGYRVPTKAQWDGVKDNNTRTSAGTFSASATNYGAGVKFGDQLMLPAAGVRGSVGGPLGDRGDYGIYWSSTEGDSSNAWRLVFNSSVTITNYYFVRTWGLSVRCVKE
jgi:uncharacterized protein (TIGR02145 family)